ncbi:NMDA receptor-regulated protein 1-domain-containing protein [Yarrowia lipolytica]|nr:NMDA receptor-regulated protein 1-domain-containing protein [Yarrowia lipolytica]RDW41241.1 NMDA receptor-regulated protein 1-domain-containing protein [Yarrowia lipolytica]
MTARAPPANRKLSNMLMADFKQCLTLYEKKEYAEAIKRADHILTQKPDHGETLAVKGLCRYHQDSPVEGRSLINAGMKNDPESYIIWHVLALLERSEKNYHAALKAYQKSLTIDPSNQNVLRDLSLMQIQTREYEPLVITRRKQLTDKPEIRANWTGLAVALFLKGDYATAARTLAAYEESAPEKEPKDKTQSDDIENCELALFRNKCLIEAKEYDLALKDLEELENKTSKRHIPDQQSILEHRCDIYIRQGKTKDAQRLTRVLLRRNPHDRALYRQLEKVLGIQDNNQLKSVMYKKLAQKYPRSDCPRSMPLEFLEGQAFDEAADAYVSTLIHRRVPSAFMNVKHLYKNPAKALSIGAIAQRIFDGATEDLSGASDFLWSACFLAQHFSKLGDQNKALKFIDNAIEHTPTLVELHLTRAKILKRMGAVNKGAEAANAARELDLQDRYLNTKAAKYTLRANNADDIEQAIKLISMFTRNDTSGTGVQDLHDMQGYWFLSELARRQRRNGDGPLALKRHKAALNVFSEFEHEQLDFHLYALRKGTMNAYIDMLQWEDKLYKSKKFIRSTRGIIETYIALWDTKPDCGCGAVVPGSFPLKAVDYNASTTVKKKKKKKTNEGSAEAKQNPNGLPTPEHRHDADPEGLKLVKNVDLLETALVHAKKLAEVGDSLGLVFQAEIYLRQNKYMLALQSLNKLKASDAASPYASVLAKVAEAQLNGDDSTAQNLKDMTLKMLPKLFNETESDAVATARLAFSVPSYKELAGELLKGLVSENATAAALAVWAANSLGLELEDLAKEQYPELEVPLPN